MSVVDETATPPAPPVASASVATGPTQTIPVREAPVWEVVAERAGLLLLGLATGMLIAAAVIL